MAPKNASEATQTFEDYLESFEQGINSGVNPKLLQPNQLAYATNVSLRGTFATHRSPYQIRALAYALAGLQASFENGRFQGANYYKPDFGSEALIAQISGRLFMLTIVGTAVTVSEISIPGDLNDATAPQAWLFQAEKWMIVTNGLANVNPIFFDGTTSRRSNFSTPLKFTTTVSTAFVIPAVSGTVTATVGATANMLVGDVITLQNGGQMVVQSIGGANTVTLVNYTCLAGNTAIVNRVMSWQHQGQELPPGRMGAYGLGRVALCLVDGKQFIIGDQVGGSSGTQAENFRDAVLNITENNYLAGGGNFSVPGTVGQIRAMLFTAQTDVSLGQGPLLVVTPTITFSCVCPTDRTQWTNVTNPILTEGMIANGGLGQYSTIGVNGDTLMRAVDGVRSYIIARRDFDTWGNTPLSYELNRVLPLDVESLLAFSSAIFFNNRMLMTVGPVGSDHGVYNQGLISLNTDSLSTVRGKQESIWEGSWLGVQPLQVLKGEFAEVERAFAFCLNTATNKIELHELLKEGLANYDDTSTRITWSFESPVLFKDPIPRKRQFKRLFNGEIFVDNMLGRVSFAVQYRPDQYPGWVNWHSWDECVLEPNPNDSATANFQPGYKTRMGLGEPSVTPCDACTNRPLRLGYTFQFRIIITGHCRFLGGRFASLPEPEPEFAPPSCTPICP